MSMIPVADHTTDTISSTRSLQGLPNLERGIGTPEKRDFDLANSKARQRRRPLLKRRPVPRHDSRLHFEFQAVLHTISIVTSLPFLSP